MRRRKPKSERKESAFLTRVTEAEHEILSTAAEKLGVELSVWTRETMLKKAAAVVNV